MKRIVRALFAVALALAVASLPHAAVSPVRAADAKPDGVKKIKVLLVTGGCCHDYGKQKQILEKGISARAPVEFTIVHEGDGITTQRHSIYEKPDWWNGFDVVIHDECSADVKDVKFIDNILAAHKAGVPAVVLHCGMHNYRSEGFPKDTPWFQVTGLHTTGHGPQEPIALTILDKADPITAGQPEWTTIKEELYNNITGNVEPTAHALVRGKQMVKDKPVETIVAWTNLYNGKTKVFATTIGHNNDTVADARYLNLVTRGLLWSVGKLDDQHFKASDQNVDLKTIQPDPHPGKKEEKKPAAAGEKKGSTVLL
jgi:type 1 glutamine amidotransferase